MASNREANPLPPSQVAITLAEIASYAGSRVELYSKLSLIWDLPHLSPQVDLHYIRSLLLPTVKCPYFRIKRSDTRTLPDLKYRRRFDAKETLKLLESIL